MSREIIRLEREVIPGLDKRRKLLANVLATVTSEATVTSTALTAASHRIESLAHGTVSAADVAIADRVVDGDGSVRGTAATMKRTNEGLRTSWSTIATIVSKLHQRAVDELLWSRKQLQRLKDQERARQRRR